MVRIVVLLALFLVACGAPASGDVTAQSVVEQFQAAGIGISDIEDGERNPDSPAPNSFKEHKTFTITSLGDQGGQVFVCDTKKNCDAMYAWFDSMKALAGPYTYQSDGGRVVAQLNSGLTPDEAAKFEAVITPLP